MSLPSMDSWSEFDDNSLCLPEGYDENLWGHADDCTCTNCLGDHRRTLQTNIYEDTNGLQALLSDSFILSGSGSRTTLQINHRRMYTEDFVKRIMPQYTDLETRLASHDPAEPWYERVLAGFWNKWAKLHEELCLFRKEVEVDAHVQRAMEDRLNKEQVGIRQAYRDGLIRSVDRLLAVEWKTKKSDETVERVRALPHPNSDDDWIKDLAKLEAYIKILKMRPTARIIGPCPTPQLHAKEANA